VGKDEQTNAEERRINVSLKNISCFSAFWDQVPREKQLLYLIHLLLEAALRL
jgi:hypothetical protein